MADKPPPPPKGAAAATGAQPSKRRDALIAMEQSVQAQWEREATFSADAVEDGRPKFFVTFPRDARVRNAPTPTSPRVMQHGNLETSAAFVPGPGLVRMNLPGSMRPRCLPPAVPDRRLTRNEIKDARAKPRSHTSPDTRRPSGTPT